MFAERQCEECGTCFLRCHYVDYSKEKAIQEIRALKEGNDADILKNCITCIACNEYCPNGARPYDLIVNLQEKKGIRFVPEEMVDFIDENAHAVANEIIPGEHNKPALSLCIMEHALPPNLTESTLFEGLTLVKGSDYYSRVVHLHSGMESRVKEHAQQFIDNLDRIGKKEIVFLHEDCYILAAKKAPEYGVAVPFKPIHLVDYMIAYLKEHRERVVPLNKKIAYQRPCISRYMPEKENHLDTFFQLVGVERVARQYDRQDALCCVSGMIELNPERALPIIDKNIHDAQKHGADVMVFLCVGCYWLMSGLCEERGLSSLFITDLGRMALGELPFASRPWGTTT
jgi:Fe-S oxidoreductase